MHFLMCEMVCYQSDQASHEQQQQQQQQHTTMADHANPPDATIEEVLRLMSGMMKDMEQLKQDVVAIAQRVSSLEQKVEAI